MTKDTILCSIPEDFSDRLTEKYEFALKNDFLIFNGTGAYEEIVHQKIDGSNNPLDIEYTVYTAKEVARPANGTKENNPFANPEPELTIVDRFGLDNEFKIVFNKFPLVPRHFMMVTHEFKPQQTPLANNELIGIYTILSKLKSTESEAKHDWFAFYNCGPQSGASQPHKHAQFMTLPPRDKYTPFASYIAEHGEAFIPDDKREPLQNAALPFAHFVAKLPKSLDSMDSDDLSMYFGSLLTRGLTVLKQYDADHVSYNVLMTTDYMMLVPRSHSKYNGTGFGVNSCGYAGLILCREKEYLDLCKNVGPDSILKELGFPNEVHEQSEEFKY